VAPGTSFAVQVLVNYLQSPHAGGTYRTKPEVVCSSCAGTSEPCLQDAKEFPMRLTVANVKIAREFEPTAEPAEPPPPPPQTGEHGATAGGPDFAGTASIYARPGATFGGLRIACSRFDRNGFGRARAFLHGRRRGRGPDSRRRYETGGVNAASCRVSAAASGISRISSSGQKRFPVEGH